MSVASTWVRHAVRHGDEGERDAGRRRLAILVVHAQVNIVPDCALVPVRQP